jgi:serine/threonine protein kinase
MSGLAHGRRVLGDRFRLVRPLGEGGMGVVWEVEDATGKHLAIKFIRDDSDNAARRVRREAQASAAIDHPNVVRVLEVADDEEGGAAIVMELLEGESLGARLAREGALGVGQTAAILRRVVSALRAAHAAGIVHRDLKPDNIFLAVGPDGSTDVRVLDFGIAKHFLLPADSLTVTGTIVGTPMYMSPEQAAGERGLDPRTDVWSIAVIAFECLTGMPPVVGDNYGQLLARLIRGQISHLADVAPDAPRDLVEAIDGALVSREERAFDLSKMEATLAHHADDVIAQPRVVVQSDPSLPVAPRSNDSLIETQAMPGISRRPTSKRRGLALGAIVGVVLAVVPAAILFRMRTTVEPVATAPSATPPAPSAAPSASAPEPAATAETVPSAKPAVHAARTPRATATATATAGATAPSATTTATGPKRLQGGVAGDVPF